MAHILGMGNALVDLMTKIDQEEILKILNLPKGSMQLVDAETSKNVFDNTANYPKVMASGGSAANTIHGLARLGVETAFIGTIGKDETGDFFHNDMKASGIHPMLFQSQTSSVEESTRCCLPTRTFKNAIGICCYIKHIGKGINIISIKPYGCKISGKR